jgi:hypothetical protein
MQHSRHSAVATRRRIFAAVLAFACLFSQLAGVLHLILVQHVACPEHGELVHADELRSEPHPGFAATRKPKPSSPAVEATSGASAKQHHSHDHCVAALQSREDSLALLGTPAVAVLQRHVDAIDSVEAVSISGGVLYRLAPKQSPPAVS